jgi:hypothetical protein
MLLVIALNKIEFIEAIISGWQANTFLWALPIGKNYLQL